MDEELRERRRWAYENPRPDVQALVPAGARRILDLGCSSGAVGAALKQRQGAEVVGVEREPSYAEDARERLDRVIVGDVEQVLAGPESERLGSFDCVIAADVLEHLRDPWSTLRLAAGLLEEGGAAVVSLPNVRHWETFFNLGWHGIWPRRDIGIFDRTHLHWFTVASALELMRYAGLEITRISRNYRLKADDWDSERQGRWFARTPLRPFFVFQFLVAGVRTPGELPDAPPPAV